MDGVDARHDPVEPKKQLCGCWHQAKMRSRYSKPFTTRKASPKAAVAARHQRIRRRKPSLEAAACDAIAMVRLLVSRMAVLIVPYQILVSRPAAAKAATFSIRQTVYVRINAPKNSTSLARKTHIPNVPASRWRS